MRVCPHPTQADGPLCYSLLLAVFLIVTGFVEPLQVLSHILPILADRLNVVEVYWLFVEEGLATCWTSPPLSLPNSVELAGSCETVSS